MLLLSWLELHHFKYVNHLSLALVLNTERLLKTKNFQVIVNRKEKKRKERILWATQIRLKKFSLASKFKKIVSLHQTTSKSRWESMSQAIYSSNQRIPHLDSCQLMLN